MSECSIKPGWSWVKFGDVVRLSKDRAANPEAEGIERYVGLEHIDPNDLRLRRWGLVAEGTTFNSRFKPGQVLFGKRRAYQRKVAVANFEGVCSGDIYVFASANPKVLLPELLPFICQTDRFFEYAIGTSAGSLSPRTNWTSLAKFEFALPPVEKQKKIALLLNSLWEFEESLLCVQEKLKLLATAAFEWGIGLRYSSNSTNKSNLFGPVISKWSEKSVGEFCLLVTDGEHATPPRAEQGIPLISARNVLNGRIDLQEVDYISPEIFERLAKRIRPSAGDVLITCSGTIGRVSIVPKNMDFAMVRSVALIRPNPELLDSQFLEIFLRSRLAARQIVALTQQTAQGNLFQSAIRRIQIPNLDLAKQKEIVANIIGYQKALDLLLIRLSKSQNLRKHLLESSLGKVRI